MFQLFVDFKFDFHVVIKLLLTSILSTFIVQTLLCTFFFFPHNFDTATTGGERIHINEFDKVDPYLSTQIGKPSLVSTFLFSPSN